MGLPYLTMLLQLIQEGN